MITEAERQLAILVGMPTISDDTGANDMALDYIEDYVTKRGMFCRRNRFDGHGTLLASTRSDTILTPKILLTAHVDVMSGSEQIFTLRREGDKLLGRGVYDMKFSIAGYLQLIDELRDSLGDYDFGLMITTDEEYGGRDDINGAHRLVEAGLRPEVCIMPDSTAPGWDIETIAKGYWRFDLVAKGITAHGSRPWEGESASLKLIHALHELKEHFVDHNVDTDSLNIGMIQGGVTYNQVPDFMTAGIEIRYISKANLKKLQTIVKEICDKHAVTREDRIVGELVKTDLKHPLVAAYLDSVQTVTGDRPKSHISCAASDAPYFFVEGINCIISCCEGGQHHSENEWISQNSFLQFVPILRDYLEKVAKIPSKDVDKRRDAHIKYNGTLPKTVAVQKT
jgi:succinyl-diaminopimelate desuccinylase